MNIDTICHSFGYSKQAFYKQRKLGDRYEREEYIMAIAEEIRGDLECYGGVKLWKALNNKGVKVGRDELFRWLRERGLLVKYKRRYVVTTDSSKWLRQFDNLVKGLQITHPNQVWVSDITYVETKNGFVYLSLITDAYSRRIMGYHVHNELTTEGPMKALYKALGYVDDKNLKNLIHHSDRGCQYCSSKYVSTLRSNNMRISTTQSGSPYDNAIAERVNGTLKREWLNNRTFKDLYEVRECVDKIVNTYNTKRLHYSLKLRTPDSAYVDSTGQYGYTMY